MQGKILLNDVEIDPESRDLIVRGKPARLPWRAFDVLLVLAETPGRVVSKEHLLRTVWGRDSIEGSNLTQAVAQIRRAMGEVSPGVSYVETIPRIGYRIVARATEPTTLPDPAATLQGSTPVLALPHRGVQITGWKYWLVALLAVLAVSVFLLKKRPTKSPSAVMKAVELPETALEGDELFPSFSPDGKQIAFVWNRRNHSTGIYTKTVGSEAIRPVVVDPSEKRGPVFSPDGRSLAFLRMGSGGSSVVIKPVDGRPEREVAKVSNPHFTLVGSPGPYLAWTKSGAGLIYSNKRCLWLLHLDTLRETQITQPPASAVLGDVDPALSPDGLVLVFSRISTWGIADLYRVQLNRASEPVAPPSLLYSDGTWSRSPAFHPDQRHLFFTSGNWGRHRLWYLDLKNTASARPFPDAGADALAPAVSPSGDMIIYSRWYFSSQIYAASLKDKGETYAPRLRPLVVSSRGDSLAHPSPDGSWIAFQSDRSGIFNVWTAEHDGSDFVNITKSEGPPAGSPDISPDGTRIAFDRLVDGQRDIFISDRVGGNVRRLTNYPSEETIPHWSADGQSMYFTSFRSGVSDIWKMNLTSGSATQMTTGGGFIAQESSDGKTLYFTQSDDISPAVFSMPSSGGSATKVLERIWRRAMSVAPEGIYYVSADARDGLRLFDPRSKATRTVMRTPNRDLYYVSVNSHHQLAILGIREIFPADLMIIRGIRFSTAEDVLPSSTSLL